MRHSFHSCHTAQQLCRLSWCGSAKIALHIRPTLANKITVSIVCFICKQQRMYLEPMASRSQRRWHAVEVETLLVSVAINRTHLDAYNYASTFDKILIQWKHERNKQCSGASSVYLPTSYDPEDRDLRAYLKQVQSASQWTARSLRIIKLRFLRDKLNARKLFWKHRFS